MFGNVRGVAISLSLLAALRSAVLMHAVRWASAAIAAAAISALLILLTFSPWLLAGLAIDIIIFVLSARTPLALRWPLVREYTRAARVSGRRDDAMATMATARQPVAAK
jgi:hypothetical protein